MRLCRSRNAARAFLIVVGMAGAACSASPTSPSTPRQPLGVESPGTAAFIPVGGSAPLSGMSPLPRHGIFESANAVCDPNLRTTAATPSLTRDDIVVDIERKSVRISWHPSFGGLPICWKLFYIAPFASAWADLPPQQTSITYGPLPPGHYEVSVCAWNNLNGTEEGFCYNRSRIEPFDIPGETTPPPCAPPGAPVLTSQVTGRSVFLAWTRATSDDYYDLEVNGNILPPPLRDAAVNYPSAPEGTFVVRVRTRNQCGQSGWSNAETLRIAAPAPPPPPAPLPPPPPPPTGPLTILTWRAQVNIRNIGTGYRTTGTLDMTLNRPVTGSYRAEFNSYPFIGQRRTFSNASQLHFDLDHTSGSCPDFHGVIPLYLFDASNRIVASSSGRFTGTGCAFNDGAMLASDGAGIGSPP